MDWQQVERAGGKVVTYGSFKLGVVEKDSDLDLLAVVPRHVSREDFFADFYHHLAKKSEVSELRALSKAFVPVIKFKYKDIDVDLTVARLMCKEKIPEDEDFLMHHAATVDLDARCLRSLNGYRATRELLQLVPDVGKFQAVLRLVKLWARRQGIYGNMLGFLGGASWAILVAKACQLEGEQYPGVQQPIVYLVVLFFKVGLSCLFQMSSFVLILSFLGVLCVAVAYPSLYPRACRPSAQWSLEPPDQPLGSGPCHAYHHLQCASDEQCSQCG